MSEPRFHLPDLKQKVVIIGSTGSGKTQFGTWLLSKARFDVQPFVIFDYKRDELIAKIDRIVELDLNKLPKHPGLYVYRPNPSDSERVERLLWSIWSRERIGVYGDEAYMLPDKSASFNAILTQGRSKRIPVYICTQRPAWLSRFVFSEASFYAVFRLSDAEDRKTVRRFMPEREDLSARLPPYTCRWYDVSQDVLFHVRPVPDADEIADEIDARLKPARKSW